MPNKINKKFFNTYPQFSFNFLKTFNYMTFACIEAACIQAICLLINAYMTLSHSDFFS